MLTVLNDVLIHRQQVGKTLLTQDEKNILNSFFLFPKVRKPGAASFFALNPLIMSCKYCLSHFNVYAF